MGEAKREMVGVWVWEDVGEAVAGAEAVVLGVKVAWEEGVREMEGVRVLVGVEEGVTAALRVTPPGAMVPLTVSDWVGVEVVVRLPEGVDTTLGEVDTEVVTLGVELTVSVRAAVGELVKVGEMEGVLLMHMESVMEGEWEGVVVEETLMEGDLDWEVEWV